MKNSFLENNVLFRELTQLLPVGLCYCDEDGLINYYNRRAVELWGRVPALNDSHDCFCGAFKVYLTDGTFVPHSQTPMAEVLRTGREVRGLEAIIERPDSSRIPVEVNVVPLRDAEGNIRGAVNCFQDITERKQAESERARAEQALSAQQEFLREVIDANPSVIFVKDRDGKFTLVNKTVADIYGTSIEDMVGKTDADYALDQNDLERFEQQDREVIATRQKLIIPEESLTNQRTGDVIWFQTIKTPLVSPDGSNCHVLGVAMDITARKRAEEKLRESEESYRRLVELSPDTIVVHSDGEIKYINPMGLKLLGAPHASQIVGKPITDFIHPDFHEIIKERLEMIQKGRQLDFLEEKIVRLNGQAVDVEVIGVSVKYLGKAATQSIIRDITERVRAREERMSLQVRLAAAQEDERRRISRELHDQMGQYLPSLMLGLKALETAGTTGQPATADILARLQDLAAHIACDVHNLSRDLRPTALDDFGLQVALASYTEEWAERHGITVDFYSSGLTGERLAPHVEISLYRIAQEALTNILKHARAHHASVILERTSKEISLLIEDDGQGFDADAVLETPVINRRLGLLGMQERVALAGGSLTIESAPDSGTTIIVRLPVQAVKEMSMP
ncbi:MAG: PAS domain S-box protein [Pyrinomonadaceae bacterium]